MVSAHHDAKACGYIEAVQDTARSLRRLIASAKEYGEDPVYFIAINDVAKELDNLLAQKRKL